MFYAWMYISISIDIYPPEVRVKAQTFLELGVQVHLILEVLGIFYSWKLGFFGFHSFSLIIWFYFQPLILLRKLLILKFIKVQIHLKVPSLAMILSMKHRTETGPSQGLLFQPWLMWLPLLSHFLSEDWCGKQAYPEA